MTSRRNGVRSAIVLGIVSVLAIGLLTAESASARTKTNYYRATVDNGSNSNVKYPAPSGTPSTVKLTVQNCGSAFAPPSNCANAKGTSIDSVTATLPTGWQAVDSSTLTATGLKLAPGASVNLFVQVLPLATDATTAKAVTFCVSDTTACSYQLAGTSPTLTLPLHFSFTTSPADGTPDTSVCGTKVQLNDGFATADHVPLGGVSVTLAGATDSALDPDLDTTVAQTTESPGPNSVTPGAATFGCTPKPSVGGPYTIIAVGQYAGTSILSDDSGSFVVFTKRKDCNVPNVTCQDSETGGSDTQLSASTDATTGVLGTSAFDVADEHYPQFSCGIGTKEDKRPDVFQVNSAGNKTLVITWSKQVTLKFTDNGTPHWQVCMMAPATAPFVTDDGSSTIPNALVDGYNVGTLPLCSAGIADNPCVDISRNAAQEIATITLPASWANGDPYFH